MGGLAQWLREEDPSVVPRASNILFWISLARDTTLTCTHMYIGLSFKNIKQIKIIGNNRPNEQINT